MPTDRTLTLHDSGSPEPGTPALDHEPLLIDLNGLVKLTTLGLRTLRRLDAARDIPGRVVVGRRVLFHLDVIREWVRSGLPDKERWAALQRFNRKPR